MSIVAVLNTKGGVGKTTIALNLAVGRALQGRNVLAVDGDRQGSLLAALTNRGERTPAIAVAQYVDGQALRQQVLRAASYDENIDILIDVGGRDSSALRAALLLADKVITPFLPRSFDVWALDDMSALLAEARAIKEVDVYALLSMADARGNDNDVASQAIPAGIQLLPVSVGRRKVFADAAGAGLSVLELPAARDPKAVGEMQALLAAVFN
ncbi:AAA family ATPase [Ralstonia pseudosolanacearum]|uniref:AAA family ATPase n=1 Tax=Ralstonia pseudosolanacearum TaxID=1310165 RepID=UPI00267736E3|nr:AAA family ATPase [Ralstonia pseudosolanacearum]MDO3515181.1 AAA family ATPase [Ralstonia pseudosolanacearum]MDO3634011.1 AAA family ATPase [Ralstonia pseudosolanacearum]